MVHKGQQVRIGWDPTSDTLSLTQSTAACGLFSIWSVVNMMCGPKRPKQECCQHDLGVDRMWGHTFIHLSHAHRLYLQLGCKTFPETLTTGASSLQSKKCPPVVLKLQNPLWAILNRGPPAPVGAYFDAMPHVGSRMKVKCSWQNRSTTNQGIWGPGFGFYESVFVHMSPC